MLHPLINPDSPHYIDENGKQAIQKFEEVRSPAEMLTWAEITRDKYLARLGKKEGTDDRKKIETFTNYIALLEIVVQSILSDPAGFKLEDSLKPVSYWYKKLGLEIEYDGRN